MTISAMGRNYVIFGLAMCLILLSSCQAEGFDTFEEQEQLRTSQSKIGTDLEETSLEGTISEETSFEGASLEETSLEENSLEETSLEETSSSSQSEESSEASRKTSAAEEINSAFEAHLSGLNTQDEPEGIMRFSEPKKVKDSGNGSGDERQKQLEEIRRIKAMAASQTTSKEKTTMKKDSSTSSYQEHSRHESGRKENIRQGSSQEASTKYKSGSRIMESFGLGQSGEWRCINENKNGVKEEDDTSIFIPKYELEDIIKEESIYQGSSSKTSSLVASLTQIVDKHKKGKWSTNVSIGKVASTEKNEKLDNLRVTLKSYRNTKVRELVFRSDFEEILTMAARYEELSSASVSYISTLSMYRSVIQEGKKASERVQLTKERVSLIKGKAMEKQTSVDTQLELVKKFAKKGDLLSVKIFGMKKLILKLEAEKQEVDMNFQKIVENLSRLIEESSQVHEEYLVVVRKWKEEEASAKFSYEATEQAQFVWEQFLGTL